MRFVLPLLLGLSFASASLARSHASKKVVVPKARVGSEMMAEIQQFAQNRVGRKDSGARGQEKE